MVIKTIDLRQHEGKVEIRHYHDRALGSGWSKLTGVTRNWQRGGWDVALEDGCKLYGANPSTTFVAASVT